MTNDVPDHPQENDEPETEGKLAALIPYKNPKALASYYIGIFSLFPVLGLLLGPLAFVLGVMGLRTAGANPSAKGAAHAVVGIVCSVVTLLYNPILIALAWMFWKYGK